MKAAADAAGGLAAAAATGAIAAVAARAVRAGLARRPPAGAATWARTNHRGEPVTLLEGPAVAVAAVAASALAPWLPARSRAALAIAGTGAAAFGCYDDLAGSGKRRGFRGHLSALAHGELTSGAVKIGGIGASGAAAAAVLGGPAADVVINAGLAAGGANLLNLFDLRPGRAIKVTLAAAALLGAGTQAARPATRSAARCAAAAPAGAALALLPDDLGERAMLGDAGANALGALLGTAAAATLPRPARVAVLAAVLGLTAASEVVSFTKVIERTPPLRWLDMLGRRPAAAPAAAGEQEATAGAEAQAGQDSPATAGAADGSAGTLSGPRAPAAAAGP
jgi:UDP-N-acetylmuramyl pentapeptide phosphotransferase/UDP-N-acetylglucosamine-1-phosphate transferase